MCDMHYFYVQLYVSFGKGLENKDDEENFDHDKKHCVVNQMIWLNGRPCFKSKLIWPPHKHSDKESQYPMNSEKVKELELSLGVAWTRAQNFVQPYVALFTENLMENANLHWDNQYRESKCEKG